MNRTQSVVQESAVLVGVLLPERPLQDDPLAELAGLAETAGAQVVGMVTQRRESPDVTTYLGKGKVDELKTLVQATDADVILFDNDLSPAQTRNLEQAAGTKVLDRSELILDIFASRARTVEARLAVELAQLQYSLPRLKRMWTHLSRLKMGIGMRGPGEKQLEVDRRLVEKRISELRRELKTIECRKERAVAARSERMTVSLVGYTNAGKSTLMNALTDAGVLAENKLFATLDTRTRRWQLPGWGPVLLSDTVGFIRDLPHNLIASFKATLEESRQADLLLHVADVSNPQALDQISAVYKVLEELGIEAKDTLLVLNKVDAADRGQLALVRTRYPHALPISARAGIGSGPTAGRGQPNAEPQFPGHRRGNWRGQRSAVGAASGLRRSPFQALLGRPSRGPLPRATPGCCPPAWQRRDDSAPQHDALQPSAATDFIEWPGTGRDSTARNSKARMTCRGRSSRAPSMNHGGDRPLSSTRICRMAKRALAGLRGILTGASSGIGRALAVELVGGRFAWCSWLGGEKNWSDSPASSIRRAAACNSSWATLPTRRSAGPRSKRPCTTGGAWIW